MGVTGARADTRRGTFLEPSLAVGDGCLGVGRAAAGPTGGGIHVDPRGGSLLAVGPNPGLAAETEDEGKTFPKKEFMWFSS